MSAPAPAHVPLRDGLPDFDAGLGTVVAALPCFRPPSEEEVDVSYAAYVAGDAAALCRAWREVADPTRAVVPFPASVVYPRLGLLFPRSVNAASFLITVRAGLAAGVRFRATLREEVRRSIEDDFPWLEQRHVHVPEGFTPVVDFPDVFRAFVDAPDLEDARARWQLCAAANEVQQAHYSRFAARLFRLPELERHAAREEAMAACYLAHWSPACTRELWRQTLWVLDALNAALFDWVTGEATALVMLESARSACRGGREWASFVAGLDAPPYLPPAGPLPAWRSTLA